MKSLSHPWVTGLLILVVTLPGTSCSQKGDRKPVFPVQGKVFFEGKPLPDALVILHPINDPDPDMVKPRAHAGPDGSFKVYTYVAGDGAPEGNYSVTVFWKNKRAKEKVSLPSRYQDPATSDLRIEVRPEINELKPFYLKK